MSQNTFLKTETKQNKQWTLYDDWNCRFLTFTCQQTNWQPCTDELLWVYSQYLTVPSEGKSRRNIFLSL